MANFVDNIKLPVYILITLMCYTYICAPLFSVACSMGEENKNYPNWQRLMFNRSELYMSDESLFEGYVRRL